MANILVIDDERLVRSTIRLLLLRAGHQVEEADDGVSGVNAAMAHAFDLIITDIIMPSRDGVQAITLLLQHKPDQKVIALSGGERLGQTETLDSAMTAGATAVIRKPFRVHELMETVTRVLAGADG
jgi:CheY-like chemotaxis protein